MSRVVLIDLRATTRHEQINAHGRHGCLVLTLEGHRVVQPGKQHEPLIFMTGKMWGTLRALLEPFVVPMSSPRIWGCVSTTQVPFTSRKYVTHTYPCATTTQRFLPLTLPHIPPPSWRFSARALMVFKVGGSALLQWGTRPHFIECMTSAGSSGCARRMTGAWVRGATL